MVVRPGRRGSSDIPVCGRAAGKLFLRVNILAGLGVAKCQTRRAVVGDLVGDFSSSNAKLLTPPQSPQMDSLSPEGTKPQQQEPAVVQIDPKWYAKPISPRYNSC